ncbi:MAG TPA: tRNA (N(6)-L-threonylcarbamoyladenosine(37)-C(2))-methylthiotransferase MtaB [Ignavibacteriaceae bacterium]|nr:tRNA (N(6)-L-threonylcarbamoyladenosine(37)-C(2))-methylthiotransferase MtaB [Ignavibacteriaceae bacterium]
MPQKVALHTLGCKLNFSETSTIGNQFLNKGFNIVDFKEDADIYVFNTCTVTENAEKECRQLVRRALRQNPNAYVIVTGCYAQLRPKEISKIDGVDAVLGSKEKFRLFDILNNFEKKELSCIHVSPTDELDNFGNAHSTDADDRTRAYFKIQDGCDYKCSFCTIPLARGKSRSLQPELVLKEFKELISSGYKEIILTGVNVGDYGNAFNTDLYNLLQKMVKVEGDFRIRISSIEPNLLNYNIISLTADNQKMCNHFHIPLQSGSPKILQLMQRRYKVQDYSKLISKVSNSIKDVGIGVDVIVGFPGETKEEFQKTYDFIRELPVSYLHVFTYSERPDTKAIEMEGTVDVFERKQRNSMLRILSEKKRHQFYETMIGKKLRVLFEDENCAGIIKGFSSNYVRVSNEFSDSLANKFSDVKITKIENDICTGIISENKRKVELVA